MSKVSFMNSSFSTSTLCESVQQAEGSCKSLFYFDKNRKSASKINSFPELDAQKNQHSSIKNPNRNSNIFLVDSASTSDLNSKSSSLESFLLLTKRKALHFKQNLSDINLQK